MENTPSSSLMDNGAQAVVDKQRSIQQQQDGKDAAKSEKDVGAESKKPYVQTGLTQQPEPLSQRSISKNRGLKPTCRCSPGSWPKATRGAASSKG